MSMTVYSMRGNIPPDCDGNNRIHNADIRYAVVDEWGELDVVVQSVNGVSAIIPKGVGRGARADLLDVLRERAKVLALHHYFTNHAKDEYDV